MERKGLKRSLPIAALLVSVVAVGVVSPSEARLSQGTGDSRTVFPGFPSARGALAACFNRRTR